MLRDHLVTCATHLWPKGESYIDFDAEEEGEEV